MRLQKEYLFCGIGQAHNACLLTYQGFIQQLRGPNFTQFWPPTPFKWTLDKYGHSTYYLPFVHVIPRGLSNDYLPTSFCPRSYSMTPNTPPPMGKWWIHYRKRVLSKSSPVHHRKKIGHGRPWKECYYFFQLGAIVESLVLQVFHE